MEHADVPFEWPHRQKRSRTHMDRHDRSISPSWYSSHYSQARDPPLATPFYRSFEQDQADASVGANMYGRQEDSEPPYHNHDAFNPSASAAFPDFSAARLPHGEDMAASASRRFPGDGFDFRRPVSAARDEDLDILDLDEEDDVPIDLSRDDDVIDLTADDSGYGASQDDNTRERHSSNEEAAQRSRRAQRMQDQRQRLPRGMHAIIDLDNGHEEWREATPGSPDFEIISSRTITPPLRQSSAVGNDSLDGDEVQFVRAQPLPDEEIFRRRTREVDNVLDLLGTMNGRFTHLRAQVDRFHARVNRAAGGGRQLPIPPRAASRNRGHFHVNFEPPAALDFGMVGFNMGMEPARRADPPAPTYNAPDKVPEGFTRSPQEDDVLVCPNCDIDLCTGEDDVKRQVWIVKTCGHVYCGECATNRATKKSTKGKERTSNTRPFKECVVEGCGKKVASVKSMVQVFL